MRRFGSFNHSTCKTVLNLMEAVYLRLRKIVVERVTVVKFRVDNRGSNSTGCFRIKVRTDAADIVHLKNFELGHASVGVGWGVTLPPLCM